VYALGQSALALHDLTHSGPTEPPKLKHTVDAQSAFDVQVWLSCFPVPPVDAEQRPLAGLQVWPAGHPLLPQPGTHEPPVQTVEGGEH
jgi:hypothetical protein